MRKVREFCGVSPANTHPRGGGGVVDSGRGDRRAGFGQRKDHGGNGFDRCAAPGGTSGRAVQGGSRLHRPGLSRAGGGQPRPQPRPVLVGERTDRTAVSPRKRRLRHRRDRRRDGVVRRAHRRRHGRPGGRIDRTRGRAARRAGDPRRRRQGTEPQHGRAAARFLDIRRLHPNRRGDPQPGRLTAPCGGAAASVRACRASRTRSTAPNRRIDRSLKASRSGHRRRARTSRAVPRSTR